MFPINNSLRSSSSACPEPLINSAHRQQSSFSSTSSTAPPWRSINSLYYSSASSAALLWEGINSLYHPTVFSFSPQIFIELMDMCLVLTFFSLFPHCFSLYVEKSLRKLPWVIACSLFLCLPCMWTRTKIYMSFIHAHMQIIACSHWWLMGRFWVII